MSERSKFEIVHFLSGNFVYLEGNHTDAFYIIREGNVQISGEAQSLTGEDEKLLRPGDFVGMVAVMSDHSNVDNAEAVGNVSLIQVKKKDFIGLIQYNTSIAMKMILEFSRRMRFLNDALATATDKPISNVEDTSILFNSAKYYEKQKRLAHAYYSYQKYVERFPDGEHIAEANEKLTLLKANAPPPIKKGSGRTYIKGSFIFADGEKGNELFVILSGSVQICKVLGGSEMIFAVLKQGDIFGEMALVEDKPRSASAIAYEDCSVMVIAKENFEGLTASKPQIIERLIKLLAERIWFSYKQLANTALEDPIGRMYDAIVMHLEKNHESMESRNQSIINFGPKELAKMIGIPDKLIDSTLETLRDERKVQFGEKQIRSMDNAELAKQAEFYRGVQRRQKARIKQKK